MTAEQVDGRRSDVGAGSRRPAAGEATPVRADGAGETSAVPEPALVEADLLVEDVSIDGMCGVY